MKLLLDTHTFIWLMDEPEKLSEKATQVCQDDENTLCLSTISLWEMQIKHQRGKLELGVPLEQVVREQAVLFNLLSVDAEHVLALQALPLHHNDPFDRMLLAQTKVEGASLVSIDEQFKHYDVDVIW